MHMLQNCGDKEEEKEHVGSSKGRTVARAAYFLSHAGVVHGVAAWYTLRLHKETKASISTAPGIKGRHWRQVLSSPALPPPQSPYVGKVQMAHAAVFLPCLCVFHYRKLPLPQGVWCFCVLTPVLANSGRCCWSFLAGRVFHGGGRPQGGDARRLAVSHRRVPARPASVQTGLRCNGRPFLRHHDSYIELCPV